MICPKKYFKVFKKNDIDFFCGVPDSAIKNFISYVENKLPKKNHLILPNEGSAIATSIGYYLATQKIPLVYMQNSGLGNAINPLTSLVDKEVYKIPLILFIGWRGEPNFKDEPQHIKQGKITESQLKILGIPYIVIDDNEVNSINNTIKLISEIKKTGKTHAILSKRNIFSKSINSGNNSKENFSREFALSHILKNLNKDDIIVSTTGKLSRELFEQRIKNNQTHENDFLTVGGMGHSSAIALGISINKPNSNIFCFDGDGAAIMHMGIFTNIGFSRCKKFKHIIFNNGSHESVGGQKTLGFNISFEKLSKICGYSNSYFADNLNSLNECLDNFININNGPSLLELKLSINTRKNLGRPTKSPIENKLKLIDKLKSIN
tara:strand:- start:119 stop:1252 length:1134 start_codon:yes stop_codon:yes gene_type:complete